MYFHIAESSSSFLQEHVLPAFLAWELTLYIFECLKISFWVVIGIFINFFVYYCYLYIKTPKPTIKYISTKQNEQLLSACPSLYRTFIPSIWGFTAMIQTLLFVFWSGINNFSKDRFDLFEEILQISNGQVSLHWCKFESSPDSPIVLILPGMLGKRGDHYIHRIANNLHKIHSNWSVVTKSWRGIGCKLRGKLEDWGNDSMKDLDEVINILHKNYPDRPIYALGFSYGGTQLASYLGCYNKNYLDGAVAISAPHDLYMAMTELPPAYDFFNTRSLFNSLKQSEALSYLSQNNEDCSEFIYKINKKLKPCWRKCPSHAKAEGATLLFNCFKDCKKQIISGVSTTISSIPKINKPFLSFRAADDPVSPPSHFEKMISSGNDNSNIIWVETNHGGHCGFFEGIFGDSWVDKPIIEFFTYLNNLNK